MFISFAAKSSECVEALQSPVGEEAVCLVCLVVLVVTHSCCCTEVGQHGLVVLPLRRLLPIFLVVIPVRTNFINTVNVYCAVVGILAHRIKRFAWAWSVPWKSKQLWFSDIKVFFFYLSSSIDFVDCNSNELPGACDTALWLAPCHTHTHSPLVKHNQFTMCF